MKIRISGNSVRFRLSKPEVEKLRNEGVVAEKTIFPQGKFSYKIKSDSKTENLSVSFENSLITLSVPATFISDWPENNVTGIDHHVQLDGDQKLYLLLEKDFKCLDNVLEDQSDNYENPKQTC